jgi:hypothetical protein
MPPAAEEGAFSISGIVPEELSSPSPSDDRMVAPTEAPFVYGFAACLAIGSAVILFVPVFRYLHDNAHGRTSLWIALIGLLGLSIAAVSAITTETSNSSVFLPIAAVTVGLRLSSPVLLYRGIRDRLGTARTWPVVRLLLAVVFVGLASVLAYSLYQELVGQTVPPPVALSEQFAMAMGASILIVRTAYRLRPQITVDLWPFWTSATAFAVAFIVIAPYAFPAFAIVYAVSGILGWIVAAIVSRLVD